MVLRDNFEDRSMADGFDGCPLLRLSISTEIWTFLKEEWGISGLTELQLCIDTSIAALTTHMYPNIS